MTNKEAIEELLFLTKVKNNNGIESWPIVSKPEQVEALKLAIKALESKRPRGEWLEHYSKELSDMGYFICSKCRHGYQRFERGTRESTVPWIDGQKYELHCIDNFCPNCGADMRGGDK